MASGSLKNTKFSRNSDIQTDKWPGKLAMSCLYCSPQFQVICVGEKKICLIAESVVCILLRRGVPVSSALLASNDLVVGARLVLQHLLKEGCVNFVLCMVSFFIFRSDFTLKSETCIMFF